jgi:hypothetical protein
MTMTISPELLRVFYGGDRCWLSQKPFHIKSFKKTRQDLPV